MPIKKVKGGELDKINILNRINNRIKNTNLIINKDFNYLNLKSIIELKCIKHNMIFMNTIQNVIKRDTTYYLCPECKKEHLKKINTKYSIEECKIIALKYKTKKDFIKNEPRIYDATKKHKWEEYVCSHMSPIGSDSNRIVYSYEFIINDKKFVYVGVTENIKRRNNQHSNGKSPIKKFCDLHNIKKPIPVILKHYTDKKEASLGEGLYLNKYIEEGWIPINKNPTGALGKTYTKEYTFDGCLNIALKFNTINEWKQNNFSSYSYCNRNNIYKNIKLEFYKRKPYKLNLYNGKKIKNTKEYCERIVSKYETLKEFTSNESNIYTTIIHNKWTYLLKKLKRNKHFGFHILQYSKDGLFIKEWDSVKIASETLLIDGSLISKCLNGKIGKCHGYKWKYKQ